MGEYKKHQKHLLNKYQMTGGYLAAQVIVWFIFTTILFITPIAGFIASFFDVVIPEPYDNFYTAFMIWFI